MSLHVEGCTGGGVVASEHMVVWHKEVTLAGRAKLF